MHALSSLRRAAGSAALVALSLAVAGCSDCLTFEATPNQNPQVREATITEFNPNYNADSTPVSRYSIHSFAFPASDETSGTLPDDSRFNHFGGRVVLGEVKYNSPVDGSPRTVRVSTNSVPNDSIVGDVMVVSVSLGPPATARLRFKGSLGTISPPLNPSGSATDFVNYVKQHAGTDQQINALAGAASDNGSGLGSSSNPAINVEVLNALGQPVSEALPADVQAQVDAFSAGTEFVEVTVNIGEVYYYKAASGQEYAVLIEDIFQGSLAPNLQRVTLKYIDLRVTIPEECSTTS